MWFKLKHFIGNIEETPEPIETNIIGKIPNWINGNFLRNGPGKFEIGNHKFNHWFDGMALLHQFKIDNGQVTYKSRFLSSSSYQVNKETSRIAVSEFGTLTMPDPCKNFFQRFLSRFELPKPTDNGNVNFMTYKGDYYVSTETNYMHKVDPETLESVKKVDWSKFIAVNGATAHPHTEPDGTTYNMGNSYSPKAHYNIIRVPPTKTNEDETLEGATVLCSIPSKDKSRPSYYHSFGESKHYVVFIEQPVKLDLMKIVTGKLTGSSISDSIYWDPKLNTIFHLINKQTGTVILHSLICLFYYSNLKHKQVITGHVYNTLSRNFPRRIVIPLNIDKNTPYDQNLNKLPGSTATCIRTSKDKVIFDLHGEELHEYGGLEFPQINYGQYNTRPYRYFYGCGFRHLVDCVHYLHFLFKVWEKPGLYPSEPIFVPSPNATAEDGGVILSVVITPNKSTFLLVLDAQTFEELGRAEVPVNIPYGFHGAFNNKA
uniref:Beta-carotene oxygenase 2 n=1 Tax=Neogobius melanostomus TaxID=47308 RepID=A0A8C6SQ56_9GOBI